MEIDLEKIKSDRICVRFPEWVQMKTIELIQREQRTESCSERDPLNLMTRAKNASTSVECLVTIFWTRSKVADNTATNGTDDLIYFHHV